MSKMCQLCQKKTVSGNKVSHSNKKTRRTWEPNLQSVSLTLDGRHQKMTVCNRCLKTLKKKGTLS